MMIEHNAEVWHSQLITSVRLLANRDRAGCSHEQSGCILCAIPNGLIRFPQQLQMCLRAQTTGLAIAEIQRLRQA
jgi:hypothetical protein